jgi:hypothetical protein
MVIWRLSVRGRPLSPVAQQSFQVMVLFLNTVCQSAGRFGMVKLFCFGFWEAFQLQLFLDLNEPPTLLLCGNLARN